MSGFLGFGQSGGEKDSTSHINNIFNYGLPTAKQSQATGQSDLSTGGDYFRKLLTAGRQETAQSAAPAINAQLAGADARRRQEATTGTGRTGGTAELNAEAGAAGQANIDNIINQTLQSGRKEGAEGLTHIGSEELKNAIAQLGIASSGQQTLYSGAIDKIGGQGRDFSSIISALI